MNRWSLATWSTWLWFVIGLMFLVIIVLGDHATLHKNQSLGICVLIGALGGLWALLRAGIKEWRAPGSRLRSFPGRPDAAMTRNPYEDWVLWAALAFGVLVIAINLLPRAKVDTSMPPQSLPAGALTTSQVKNHIGETAAVCGVVVSTHYMAADRTFVFIDKEWPQDVFTITIRTEDWAKFSPPPSAWTGHQVCVTGLITRYQRVPSIAAKSPGQVTVK